MRLSKIEVVGLFHKYNYTIPLNLESRITIVHGPNGYGKTTLLEVLNGIFSGSYEILEEVPFHIFKLWFDDNSKINIYETAEPVAPIVALNAVIVSSCNNIKIPICKS